MSVCTYILLSAWVLHSEMMLDREWGWFPSDLEKGAQSVSASHHACLKPPPSLPGKTESSSLHIYMSPRLLCLRQERPSKLALIPLISLPAG